MSPSRYPTSLRVLHWFIATLIIAALVMGTFVMAHMKNSDPSKLFALLKHMAVGGLILALTLLRLFIRPKTRRPRPMLSGISMADRIVPYVHRIFDVLVLVMIGSGIGIAVMTGLPGIIANGDIARLPESFHALPLHTVHVFVGRILAGIVVLHVCGALYHHFFLKDGLLARMSLAGR
ncbi:MAG: cytochrome b/b6 domain-containing protein [Propionivibrio sp.]|nr:cytochrome b/b6 domain-containing protein [Propionivibrio sp.]